MDRETMRKRGWSIHSDQTSVSERVSYDVEEGEEFEKGEDDDLNHEEKKQLLNAFPTSLVDDEEETEGTTTHKHPPDTVSPAHKRLKLDDTVHSIAPPIEEDSEKETNNDHDDGDDKDALEVAKSKLSKWAARLFDPTRIKGIVEAPQTIPLNDEFLTAFGKREREHDAEMGRTIDVDQSLLDDGSSSIDDEQGDNDQWESKSSPLDGRKVKISNLPYTISQAKLETVCQTYGPLIEVHLVMDKENPERNTGRAYVTFEFAANAETCVEKLTTLEGRALRVSMAQTDPGRSKRASGGGPSTSRYWEKDITTKCFRCGQVGHMEFSCPNEAKPRPCPLCAQTDHDMRSCPMSRICFRCGIPGHINRDCMYRQNLPKRMVCGICFQSGHHRTNCRRRACDAPSHDAKCLVCHQLGHFMCTEMKWFVGLDGISCFNCGLSGHHGYDCDRPGVDVVSRDDELAHAEIARAASNQAMAQMKRIKEHIGNQQRGRGDTRDFNGDRARPKSQPPNRSVYHGSR